MSWLHYQWFTYWWPSDKGNGPENIQWTIIALAASAFFIPAVRRFFARHFTAARAESAELHRKLDHIIKYHPDIPDYPPKEET